MLLFLERKLLPLLMVQNQYYVYLETSLKHYIPRMCGTYNRHTAVFFGSAYNRVRTISIVDKESMKVYS